MELQTEPINTLYKSCLHNRYSIVHVLYTSEEASKEKKTNRKETFVFYANQQVASGKFKRISIAKKSL